MNEDEMKAGEGEAAEKPMPKPNYDADPNVKARRRAGKRSNNRNMGKAIEEGVDEMPVSEPPVEAPAAEETPAEVSAEGEGGIVEEAKKEEEIVMEAAEEKVEETAPEAPEAEAAEGEMPEEAPEMEASEEAEPEMPEEPEMYQAPEGPAHDELIDQYHEALAFGDMETAKALYKQLQDHRFRENTHRAKTEAQAEQEAKAYVAAATELAAAHPELAEDGLPATKVLALSDVYRQEGMSAADALRKAVADLYPESPAEASAPEAVAPEVTEAPKAEEPAMEQPAEETAAPVEEESVMPDMEERKAAKRSIPAMPSASARNEPAPPPRQPTRSDAIQQMKERRGQA